jgi:hypothetical protein
MHFLPCHSQPVKSRVNVTAINFSDMYQRHADSYHQPFTPNTVADFAADETVTPSRRDRAAWIRTKH